MGSHYALYDPCGVDIHVSVVSGEERQDAGQIIELPFPLEVRCGHARRVAQGVAPAAADFDNAQRLVRFRTICPETRVVGNRLAEKELAKVVKTISEGDIAMQSRPRKGIVGGAEKLGGGGRRNDQETSKNGCARR